MNTLKARVPPIALVHLAARGVCIPLGSYSVTDVCQYRRLCMKAAGCLTTQVSWPIMNNNFNSGVAYARTVV
jgi:hypothetical protein